MKKLTVTAMLIGMFVLVVTFAFTTTVAAQRVLKDWVVMTYYGPDNWNVPGALPVTPIRGNGVSFDFYPTPDRAMLIAEIDSYAQFRGGKLTGKTLSADIAIEATPGATFNYYDNNTGGSPTGGFVRLYFNKVNTEGCPTGWHPERPDCEAQYWWSNPLHIDLVDLAALGSKGTKLEVPLDPEFWSDRDGHMGTDTTSNAVNHTDAFNAAVANVHKIGLSFGGAGWWAFGCGVNEPSTATFKLYKFMAK
jgi:hypothetical protein